MPDALAKYVVHLSHDIILYNNINVVGLTFLPPSINSAVYILSTLCTIQYGTYLARLCIIIITIYTYHKSPFFRYFSLPCTVLYAKCVSTRLQSDILWAVICEHILWYIYKHLYIIYFFIFNFFQLIR